MKLSRRNLLLSAALTPVAFQAQAMGLGDGRQVFDAAVRQIGGVVDISDILVRAAAIEFTRKFGAQARHEFIAAMGGQTVELALKQAGSNRKALREQIAFIANFLYTGEVERNGETVVLYYPWCLAWNATGFTKPPGICGGPHFGHWGERPWQ